MDNEELVSPSRQCFRPPVGVCQGFLSKEECDNTGASLTLSWPGRIWFYVFPRLKSALKGWSVFGATDIIKNATEELKRLSRKGLQERFQSIYSHWQKCIVADRYYFEGNVAEVIVLLCIAQNILKPPHIRKLSSFAVSVLNTSTMNTLLRRGMAGWLICFYACVVILKMQHLQRQTPSIYLDTVYENIRRM